MKLLAHDIRQASALVRTASIRNEDEQRFPMMRLNACTERLKYLFIPQQCAIRAGFPRKIGKGEYHRRALGLCEEL